MLSDELEKRANASPQRRPRADRRSGPGRPDRRRHAGRGSACPPCSSSAARPRPRCPAPPRSATRSMELLRAWGLEDALRAGGNEVDWILWRCETLTRIDERRGLRGRPADARAERAGQPHPPGVRAAGPPGARADRPPERDRPGRGGPGHRARPHRCATRGRGGDAARRAHRRRARRARALRRRRRRRAQPRPQDARHRDARARAPDGRRRGRLPRAAVGASSGPPLRHLRASAARAERRRPPPLRPGRPLGLRLQWPAEGRARRRRSGSRR